MLPEITGSLGFVLVAALLTVMIWLPFNWRAPVAVTRIKRIKAPTQVVWQAAAFAAGKKPWHPHIDRIDQIGENHIRLEHSMTKPCGNSADWSFDMEIDRYDEGEGFRACRTGLDGEPANDRLLTVEMQLERAGNDTIVKWAESWGPRSTAGRFMAHADAAGMLTRLQSYCETGHACSRRAALSAGILSALSALVTVAAFAVLLGWPAAIVLVAILVLHELGHLVSFRLVGQPWGRIMFVPFIGGVAVSRLPHTRLKDDVFCALMGAGLSLLALIPAAAIMIFAPENAEPLGPVTAALFAIAALAGAVNLLNLLPIFPMDGGRVMRAILQSVAPKHVCHIMLVVAGAMGIAAIYWHNAILAALAVIAFFQSHRLGEARAGVERMGPAAITTALAGYLALSLAHGGALYTYWGYITA